MKFRRAVDSYRMATYAIGDVQGCADELRELLGAIRFDGESDRLWFVGDLVNRGPKSLDTLRLVRALGEAAVCVLGNHDFHLLCRAEGFARKHDDDTLDEVLAAPDAPQLLAWLRARPLMHAANGLAMVHAGLLPQWTVPQALALAGEVEAALRGPHHLDLLQHMYGNEPTRWLDGLAGFDRLRVVINAMTRMRLVSADDSVRFDVFDPEGRYLGAIATGDRIALQPRPLLRRGELVGVVLDSLDVGYVVRYRVERQE